MFWGAWAGPSPPARAPRNNGFETKVAACPNLGLVLLLRPRGVLGNKKRSPVGLPPGRALRTQLQAGNPYRPFFQSGSMSPTGAGGGGLGRAGWGVGNCQIPPQPQGREALRSATPMLVRGEAGWGKRRGGVRSISGPGFKKRSPCYMMDRVSLWPDNFCEVNNLPQRLPRESDMNLAAEEFAGFGQVQRRSHEPKKAAPTENRQNWNKP